MQIERQSYRKSFFISLLLHVGVLGFLIFNFQFSSVNYVLKNNSPTPVVQASVVTSMPTPKPVTAPLQPPKVIPPMPAPKPIQQVTPPPKVIPIEKPKTDVIALKMKKQKEKLQKQLEKQLLADLNKQKQLKKQKALEKAFASEMRNLSKPKPVVAASEKLPAMQADSDKMHGIVDKYRALILSAIEHKWLIPGNADKNAATKLMIRLEAGGIVKEVDIVDSSGNVALDNSARSAVYKASPLPVPEDPEEFAPFKQFVMVFKPMMFQ